MRATLFLTLLEERDWSMYEVFCSHYVAAGRELAHETGERKFASITLAERTFERWKSGEVTVPHRDARRVLRKLFNQPVDVLFGPPIARQGSRSPRPFGSARAGVAGHVITESALAERPVPTPSDAGFGVREEIVAQTQTLLRSNTDPAVISLIDASIQNIVDRYEALGPHHLAPDARLLRGTLLALLNGLQPPRVRSELFSMAAKAAGLLGYMSVNAGASYAVTDAYCAEAEQLADEAGRSDLQAWAHGTRSLGLYYAGRYAEADAAAEAGIELAPSSAQAIRLLINGRARALARLGRRKDAERAISQAFELSDQQATLPGGLTACIAFAPYSRARTLANAITAHLSLGDASKVLHYAEEIEGLIEQADSDWSRALVRLDVATALLRQKSPEVEHAMALGRSALRAGSARPIRSVWQRALELHDQASPWQRQHAVAEFGDELRSWRSQPQAELVAAAGD